MDIRMRGAVVVDIAADDDIFMAWRGPRLVAR